MPGEGKSEHKKRDQSVPAAKSFHVVVLRAGPDLRVAQTKQARLITNCDDKKMVVVVLRDFDGDVNPERLYQIRDGISMRNNKSVAMQLAQFARECRDLFRRNNCRSNLESDSNRRRGFFRALELCCENSTDLRIS